MMPSCLWSSSAAVPPPLLRSEEAIDESIPMKV